MILQSYWQWRQGLNACNYTFEKLLLVLILFLHYQNKRLDNIFSQQLARTILQQDSYTDSCSSLNEGFLRISRSLYVPEAVLQQQRITTTIMKLLKNVKSIVEKCDFFCPTEFFRYKKEPQYQTVLGGTVSLLLMLVLAVAFSNKLIATLNMMSISSSFSSENADDPKEFEISTFGEEQRNFMFGVQIWHFNLNDGPTRYFDIVLTNTDYLVGETTQNSTQYALQQCTKDHWKGYPSILQKFDRLNAHYWLCLPKDHTFKIKGKYSSINSNTLDVAVRKCSSQSLDPRPCASQDQIDQFFVDYGHKVFFTIYFTNPLVNPDEPNYLTYYLQDRNYIIFSQKGGEQAQLLMEDYEITTDQSITPLENMVSDTGGIIQDTAIKNRYQIGPDQSTYCTFFIYKSPLSIKINRGYQKLDEIFSYIGGLLGTIVMLLFIVKSYNGYSFQIILGSYLYKHDEVREGFKKYNFLYFLAQMVYSPLRAKLKSSQLWERVRRYHHCRAEVLKQMDILYLLKRVGFLERALEVIFDEHQIKGIHLMRKLTLEEVKQNRKQFKALSSLQYKEDQNNLGAEEKQMNMQIASKTNLFKINTPIVANSQLKKSQSIVIGQTNRSNRSDDSSSSSSQGEGQTPQVVDELDVLKIARRFKLQKDTSSLSKRIYEGLDESLKTVIENNQQIQNVSRLSHNKQFYFLEESVDIQSNNPSNIQKSKEQICHPHD